MIRLATSTFLACCLAACATSSGPTLAEAPIVVPEGKAVVLVYRISALTSAAYRHNVYLDGKLLASLPSGSFTHIPVTPGTYEVSTGNEKNPRMQSVSINVERGETVYVAYSAGRDLSTPASLRLSDSASSQRYLSGDYRFEAAIIQP